MFRDVLVPLDQTRFAEAALPVAARLARGGAHLHLVLSHEFTPVSAGGMGELVPPSMAVEESLRDEEQAYLTKTAASLALQGGSPVEYREAEGDAGAAICAEAIRVGADLIVMAGHQRGPLGKFWYGSVADYVIRHARTPVLLLHPSQSPNHLLQDPLRGILVALDLSPASEAILEPAAVLARLTHAPLILVHTILEPVTVRSMASLLAEAPEPPAMAIARVGQQLEAIADRLRAEGLDVSTRVTTGFNPAWTLRQVASESGCDVLALTTHGRGAVRRALLGSVASQLLHESTKPVLILHPPTPASATVLIEATTEVHVT